MELLDRLRKLRIHLVGITSLEIADVACFLGRRGVGTLVGHDLCDTESLWEHFRAAHIGMPREERRAHWEALQSSSMPLHLGEAYLKDLDEAEVIVASQAWRLYERNAPLARRAEEGDALFLTPVEIYLEIARDRSLRTVGITGSNGKSTTTNMTAAMLAAAGIPVVLAGNYRYRGPILEALAASGPDGVLVLELSNHHLMALRNGVGVGVVTNVTPNHLDEHGGLSGYVAVKRRMAEIQPEGGLLVLNDDDPISRCFAQSARGRVERFSLKNPDADAVVLNDRLFLNDPSEGEDLIDVDELPVPGLHNVQNALAAALAARGAGAGAGAIAAGLRGYEGAPGRLELVRTVADVRFYWDVESTTPESTIRGLEAFPPGTVHLIAGGDSKGLSYVDLARTASECGAQLTLLDGSASPLMASAWEATGQDYDTRDTLEEAIAAAFARARPGDVVLVSPGAKGFYNRHVRGKPSFARLVKRLRAAQRGAVLDQERAR